MSLVRRDAWSVLGPGHVPCRSLCLFKGLPGPSTSLLTENLIALPRLLRPEALSRLRNLTRDHRASRPSLRHTNKSSSPLILSQLQHSRSHDRRKYPDLSHGGWQPPSRGGVVNYFSFWPGNPCTAKQSTARTPKKHITVGGSSCARS